MKTIHLMLFSGMVALAGCTDGPAKGPGGEGEGGLSVIDWANDMARASRPDTIQDKFAIVIDTDDRHAFDGVIEVARENAAAEAAAGD